jgi:hypothetical protein
MSDLSIPVGLDPHDIPVPIQEAQRKTDYYVCPECKEFLTPRIGPQRQYFAHKQGVLDDTDCSLSSRADIERMVDDLRTPDIEEGERERNIRVYLGEPHDGHIDAFGIIPSIEWDDFPPTRADALLDDLEITTTGVNNPPVAGNFHPSESEVFFNLDPTAEEFVVDIQGPDELSPITGRWTADSFEKGDLFVGDQSRARRHRSNRQIKEGEWVYLLTIILPNGLPEVVETNEIGSFNVLAFPARESTEDLLEEYGEGLTTDDYGFDADVILPAHAHPTVEAPIYGDPNETVLVGITPAKGIDQYFEVVSIPKRANETIDVEPTGPGNPRFYPARIPCGGSQRVSIHQRNSNRHRLIHLHPHSEADNTPSDEDATGNLDIGVEFIHEGDTTLVSPLDDDQTLRVDEEFNPHILPSSLSYCGPEGLEVEVTASFVDESNLGPTITRFTDNLEDIVSELSHWVTNGCETVSVEFGGLGSVHLEFPQPALATSLDTDDNAPSSVSKS